jgi:drug/metabolite transporter superfamily protein YnfA
MVRLIAVAALYCVFFWRAIKGNRKNKLIVSGCVALTVFMILIVLINVDGVPDRVMEALGGLLLFLCLLTMFFLFQRAIKAIRRGKAERSP